MAGKMPSKPMTIGRSLGNRAATLGPNPANRIESNDMVGPARFEGDFTPGRKETQCKYIMQKPLSTEHGRSSKQT